MISSSIIQLPKSLLSIDSDISLSTKSTEDDNFFDKDEVTLKIQVFLN